MKPLRGLSRRQALEALLLGAGWFACEPFLAVARAAAPSSGAATVTFDAEAATKILHWAQSDDTGDPPEWRTLPAYELAREQAEWSGQASPDLQVQRALARIREEKQQHRATPTLSAAATLAVEIMEGHEQFLRWAVPHLRSYLPARTAIRGAVALAAFLPNYAFSMNDTIVVSVTDPFWRGDPARVFNLLVHELFHNGFIQFQRGNAPADAPGGRALLRTFLWSLQNEGMATYVAYRARSDQLGLEDYRLLDTPGEVEKRFQLCRAYVQDLDQASAATLPRLRQRFWELGSSARAPYIAGAAMARRIDQRLGRERLVGTVEKGPVNFLETYRATRPAAELSL